MPRLSLAKLERHLYSAADRLRQEGLDAATYKDYIFGMLFLKRCSDVFDAEHENDDACKDLVRHFNRHRLRNEDFQFSDLLGAAYEFLINMFAESVGKKGGDFYTPRDVIRLMVRVLKPAPGMSVYDPTCGSGGMLIISRGL